MNLKTKTKQKNKYLVWTFIHVFL